MGCPYNSRLVIGFILTKKSAKQFAEDIDEMEERMDDSDDWWSKNVGDFETQVFSNERETKFFVSLVDIKSMDNCEYVSVIQGDVNNSFEKAFAIYDNSPFLKERFDRKDIKLLLTCEYIG